MKAISITKITAIAVIATALAGATSCSTHKRQSKTAGKEKTETKKPSTPHRTAESRDSDKSDGIYAAMDGEWQIIKAGKTDVPITDDMPYINFDTSDGRFYASDGCNIINGDFTVATGAVTFDHVMSTLRMCPEVECQQAISGAISDGKPLSVSFESTDSDDVTLMQLKNQQGKSMLTLRRSDMTFLNGMWQIIKIGNKQYDNPEMNIFFDIPGLKVHGNTGCNYFNGSIYTDPKTAASLNFGHMGVTRMACPDQGVETSMLVALEQVCSARLSVNGEALLNDAGGTTLLVLRRAAAPEE